MYSLSDAATKEQLISDFKAVVHDAEELLNAAASQGGGKLADVRAKTEESLRIAKARMNEAQGALRVKTKAAARATDAYAHENPWKVVGISAGVAAAVGLVVGLLLERR